MRQCASTVAANPNYLDNLTASFNIAGAGSGPFGSAYVFAARCGTNGGSGVGLESYESRTAIGPISDNTPSILPFTEQSTSAGALSLTSVSSSTFQATTSSAVPEPSTVMLLATGWQDSVSRRA